MTRDLEEDDPEHEHVEPMRGQHQVKPVSRKQVHRRPAREQHEQREDTPTSSETTAATAFQRISFSAGS